MRGSQTEVGELEDRSIIIFYTDNVPPDLVLKVLDSFLKAVSLPERLVAGWVCWVTGVYVGNTVPLQKELRRTLGVGEDQSSSQVTSAGGRGKSKLHLRTFFLWN